MNTTSEDVKRLETQRRERQRDEQRRVQQDRDQQRKRDKLQTADESALLDLAVAIVASPADLEDFQLRLDRYDAATTEALLLNEVQLAAVQERLREMLLRAHVLEDGRRVFKTRDGEQVFDERGVELGSQLVDPRAIPDDKPRWEDYRDMTVEKDRILEDRQRLHDYQEKLDNARERLDGDSITKQELDDLGAELKAEMPKSARNIYERASPDISAASPRQLVQEFRSRVNTEQPDSQEGPARAPEFRISSISPS